MIIKLANIKKNLIENGDVELEKNLELIIWFIKKIQSKFHLEFNNVYTIEDAFMDGILAYYEAKKNYNPEKAKFSTYLFYYVWNKVFRGYKKSSIVSVPIINKNPYIVNKYNIISFENMLNYSDDPYNNEMVTWEDLKKLADYNCKQEMEDNFFLKEISNIIEHSLCVLTPIQKQIFCSYFGFNTKKQSPTKIGKRLKISKQAVFYSLETSIKKIKKYIKLEFPSLFELI